MLHTVEKSVWTISKDRLKALQFEPLLAYSFESLLVLLIVFYYLCSFELYACCFWNYKLYYNYLWIASCSSLAFRKLDRDLGRQLD